jgi:hypothetical protein
MNFSKLIIYRFDRHVLKWPRYYGIFLGTKGKLLVIPLGQGIKILVR